MDDYVLRNETCNIWVTQPRRIAAMSVADRVAEKRCEKRNKENCGVYSKGWGSVGEGIVGYQVGLDKRTCKDTRITYMTPGIVSNKMRSDPRLDDVDVLIIDEVHERDLETEMLLLLVKDLMDSSNQIKIILMSATMQAAVLRDYLVSNTCSPVVLNCVGKLYEIEEFYIEDISKLYPNNPLRDLDLNLFKMNEPEMSAAVQSAVCRIINYTNVIEQEKRIGEKGAVLIFLPGINEIKEMEKNIQRCCQDRLDIILMHSSLPIRGQQYRRRLMSKARNGYRKIVLSTNICESSITVPDVTFVIDLCLTKYLEKDADTNLTQLKLKWASHDQCTQRKGRAGRIQNGYCWRLVPKEFYKSSLLSNVPPEIERLPLEKCVLLGKAIFPQKTPKEFLDKACAVPKNADIEQAVIALKEIQALSMKSSIYKSIDDSEDEVILKHDTLDGDLTPLGKLMNLLPLELSFTRLIYFGNALGLITEAIIIAACMNNQNLWEYNIDQSLKHADDTDKYIKSYKSRLYWAAGSQSDHIAMLNAFITWYTKVPPNFLSDILKYRSQWVKFLPEKVNIERN